jgi:quinoprotein dehydrogenase-associated probable ABC transporter substrate-binding protein
MDYSTFIATVSGGKKEDKGGTMFVMPSFGEDRNIMCYIDDIYTYIKARSIYSASGGKAGMPPGRPNGREDISPETKRPPTSARAKFPIFSETHQILMVSRSRRGGRYPICRGYQGAGRSRGLPRRRFRLGRKCDETEKKVIDVRKQTLTKLLPAPAAVLAVAGILAGLAMTSIAEAAEVPRADLVNRKELRVCADPADLPFSNNKGEGFENKIANIIGDELKIPVVYTWFPKAMGFVRMTLNAKRCDLVIGWGQGDDMVLNTNAIYRSTSALIYKKGTGLDGIDTLADPRLQGKPIGIVQGSPGGDAAAKYGLMANVKGYPMMVDRRYSNPTADMMNDIRSGTIVAGVQWGPMAEYWASRGGEKLVVVPLLKEKTKLAFRITMGVRNGDDAWKRQLNDIIRKRRSDIDQVLLDYGVPLLVDDDTSMEMVTKPRPSVSFNAGATAEKSTETGPGPAAPAH